MRATFCRLFSVAGLIAPAVGWTASPPAKDTGDEPVEIVRTVDIEYPTRLAVRHIDEGEVRAVVWVDENGHLLDWLLVGASHPLFAKEVLDVLPKWHYRPAYRQGRPVCGRVEIRATFKSEGFLRIESGMPEVTSPDNQRAAGQWASAQRIYNPDELDKPLDPVVEITPESPEKLGAVATQGKVIVEYLIDAEGKVRMPIVTESDDDAFTNSVLLAITEWRYEVPKHTGRPVVARARREFTFSPAS